MPIEDIAGFGGVTFSVLIGIAVVVSLDKRLYEAKLEKLVWVLFFSGMFGSLLFPSIATSFWCSLSVRGKIAVVTIDVVGLVAIITLICYFVKLLNKKGFREREMKEYFPDDAPLDQDDPDVNND